MRSPYTPSSQVESQMKMFKQRSEKRQEGQGAIWLRNVHSQIKYTLQNETLPCLKYVLDTVFFGRLVKCLRNAFAVLQRNPRLPC